MGKVFTIPVLPDPKRTRKPRRPDPKYVQGQKLLVEAMRYLARENSSANRDAISFLSEHFRTQFRMDDHPSLIQ
jgi:hypothetical protein